MFDPARHHPALTVPTRVAWARRHGPWLPLLCLCACVEVPPAASSEPAPGPPDGGEIWWLGMASSEGVEGDGADGALGVGSPGCVPTGAQPPGGPAPAPASGPAPGSDNHSSQPAPDGPAAPAPAGDPSAMDAAPPSSTAQASDAAVPDAGPGLPPESGPEPVPAMPPLAGELLITELMPDPAARTDAEGEWVELYNASDRPLELGTCALGDPEAPGSALPEQTLDQGAYLAIARSGQPGFAPGAVVGLSLRNSSDTVVLRCAGAEVDRVAYGGEDPRKVTPGASLSLSATAVGRGDNDDPGDWCAGQAEYATDLGTPGAPNGPCEI